MASPSQQTARNPETLDRASSAVRDFDAIAQVNRSALEAGLKRRKEQPANDNETTENLRLKREREEAIKNHEAMNHQEFPRAVNEESERTKDEDPTILKKIKTWLAGNKKTCFIIGGLVIGLGIYLWFKKDTEKSGDKGGFFDWLKNGFSELKKSSEKKLLKPLLFTALSFVGLTGVGALGVMGIDKLCDGLAEKINLADLTEAIRKTKSGEDPLAIYHFLMGLDLPEDFKAAVEKKLKEKISGTVAAVVGPETAKKVQEFLDDASVEKGLKDIKAYFAAKGLPSDFLDKIPKAALREQMASLATVIGPERMALLSEGKDVVINKMTLKAKVLGGSLSTILLLALAHHLFKPLNLAKYGVTGFKYGVMLGGGALAFYLGLKLLGVDVMGIDGLIPDEIRLSMAKLPGEAYIDEISAFLQDEKVVAGITSFTAYTRKRFRQFRQEPYVQKFLPNAEQLLTLSGFDFVLAYKQEGAHLPTLAHEAKRWAGAAGAVGAKAMLLGLLSMFAIKKPSSALLKGVLAFSAYCLYQNQKESGLPPDELNALGIASYMTYEAVETTEGWAKDFYGNLVDNLAKKEGAQQLVKKIKDLHDKERLEVNSFEWVGRFFQILREENISGVMSEGVFALFTASGSTLFKIALTNQVDSLKVIGKFAFVGSEEALIEYSGVVAPFVAFGAVLHPEAGPIIGGLVGAGFHFIITRKGWKFLYKSGRLISHIPDAKNIAGLFFGRLRRADLIALSHSSIISRVVSANPQRVEELLKLYAEQHIEFAKLGIPTKGIAARYQRVYARYGNVAGVAERGLPATLDAMIEKFKDLEISRLSTAETFPPGNKFTHNFLAQHIAEIRALEDKAEGKKQAWAQHKKLIALQEYKSIRGGFSNMKKYLGDRDLFTSKDRVGAAFNTATYLEALDGAVNARVAEKLEEIAEATSKYGRKSSQVAALIAEVETKYLRPYAEVRQKTLEKLTRAYKEIPRGERTLKLVQQYRYAKQGAPGSFALSMREAFGGRMKIGMFMAGVSVALAIPEVVGSKDPIAELWHIFKELGPSMVQMLVDCLPGVGTISLFTGAVAGQESTALAQEWITGKETKRGELSTKQRWKNVGWGTVSLIGDIGLVLSAGLATPAIIAGRIAKLGKTGEIILKFWPQMAAIMDKIGVARFAEIAAKFAKGEKELVGGVRQVVYGANRIEKYAVGGMILAEVGDYAYSHFSEVDVVSDKELDADAKVARHSFTGDARIETQGLPAAA